MNTEKTIRLGSLFDGIGGFPYAGSFFGIEPLWASEILPQAVSVTKRRFPAMGHVGDVTKLDGSALTPVDIITFGSPCQDLSVAGRRAGLEDGARSNLFYQAIRIIDEMRRATNGKYPSHAVWENVPGALSSGRPKGVDFAAVLSAFTKTEIPVPPSGTWANAGMARGDGVTVAWRVLNAAMWGVPQRRRRIFLVASFGAGCAGEVLFVEKSLRGYPAPGGETRQGTPADASGGAGSAMPGRGGVTPFSANQRDEVRDLGTATGALQSQPGMKQQTFIVQNCLTPWDVQSRRVHEEYGKWPALYSAGGGGHGYAAQNCLNPWDAQQSRVFTGDGNSPTLAGADGGGGRNPGGLVAAFLGGASAKARSIGYSEEVSPTLKAEACGFSSPCLCEPKTARTLTARGDGSPNVDGGPNVVALGVHQNQSGDVNVSDTAYTLAASSNPSARQAPLVAHGLISKGDGDCFLTPECHTALSCGGGMPGQGYPAALTVHPEVAGTLVASGAGLSRTGGMASEPDLCVAYALQGNMIGRQERNGPRGLGISEELSYTLTVNDTPGVAAPIPIQDKATRHTIGNGLGVGKPGDPAPTITAGDKHGVAAVFNRQRSDEFKEQDVACTQAARQCKDATDLVCEADVSAVDCRNYKEVGDCSGTLRAKNKPGYSLNFQNPVRTGYIVRRLTPTECERLQGYPDGYTAYGHDGKEISDTRRYMMLGNSVAIPCVAFVLGNIAAQIREVD